MVIFDEELLEITMAKLDIAENKLQLRTKTVNVVWSEEKLNLLSDVDYDDLLICKYYLRFVIIKFPQKDQLNQPSEGSDKWDIIVGRGRRLRLRLCSIVYLNFICLVFSVHNFDFSLVYWIHFRI